MGKSCGRLSTNCARCWRVVRTALPSWNSADALVELASSALATDTDGDRACIVVHVDAGVLVNNDGVAELEDGPAIAAETARRLAYDAHVESMIEGPVGPLGVGRKRRTVPPWLS